MKVGATKEFTLNEITHRMYNRVINSEGGISESEKLRIREGFNNIFWINETCTRLMLY